MDLLSDVFQTLRLTGAIFLRGEFTAPWAISAPTATEMASLLKPGHGRLLIFHIIAEGDCRIELRDGETAFLKGPGVVLIPHGQAHTLSTRTIKCPCKPVSELLPQLPWSEFPILSYGGGGETTKIVCGYLHFANRASVPFLDGLPSLIPYEISDCGDGQAGGLKAILEYTIREAEQARPGAASLVFRSAELFFVQLIRQYMEAYSADGKGWFAALNDPIAARAVRLIHDDPAFPWTVEKLAQRSFTSRSNLADRFKRQLGYSPMQYLSRWRIELAAHKLSNADVAISDVAADVGFSSQSAFYRAFRRIKGVSPAILRNQGRRG